MPYALFHDRFPELSDDETRTISLLGESDDPLDEARGSYGLFEMYCDEPGCDCRRVMFYVVNLETGEPVAQIGYGWDTPEFYRRRFTSLSDEDIDELIGPSLNVMGRQSAHASLLLDIVSDMIRGDRDFVERLKRHYRMFRDTVDRARLPPLRPGKKRGKRKR